MQEFIRGLSQQGISEEELGWMIRKNPARLLGLEPL
jgi:predicted metal-dependent phosphotriesterase family hydrolase